MQEESIPGVGLDNQELTSEEALQLAEVLKKKLDEQQVPASDQESLRQMVSGLGDQRGALRLTFAQSLGAVGEIAVPILCESLKQNPNVVIRRASAKTLNIIGSEKALPNLLEAFQTDDDPVVQGSSAGAMSTIGAQSIEPLLQMLTQDNCSAFQVGLINLALGFIGSKAPEAFIKATQSDNTEIRIAALGALAEQIQTSRNGTNVGILLNALKDQSAEVRAEAATMAGKSLEAEEYQCLTELLRDTDSQVRKNAALALMKMDGVQAIESLNNAIEKEKDEQVKAVFKVATAQLARRME